MKPRSQLWYGAPPYATWRAGASGCTLTLGLLLVVLGLATRGRSASERVLEPARQHVHQQRHVLAGRGPAALRDRQRNRDGRRGPGRLRLVATYLSRPIILNVASPGRGGSDQFVVDNQVTGNFLFAYGVSRPPAARLRVPVTFVQTGAGTSPLTGGARSRMTRRFVICASALRTRSCRATFSPAAWRRRRPATGRSPRG